MSELGEALTRSRIHDFEALHRGMLEEGFLGVTGDPQVGKSHLLRRAAAAIELEGLANVIQVDLDGAYSPRNLATRWLKAVARAAAGAVAYSHIEALPRSMWPEQTRSAARVARDVLGPTFDTAFVGTPKGSGDQRELVPAIEATVKLAERGRTILVIDHVEGPLLSGRPPFDLDAMLWSLRGAAQNAPRLDVIVAGEPDVVERVAGDDAPFFGDGEWLTITPPSDHEWDSAVRDEQIARAIPEVLRLAGDHVPSALMLFDELARDRRATPHSVFKRLADHQQLHAGRCLLHASTLHRLGTHLMVRIANGEGPYEATPDTRSRDVAAAVRALSLAGLIKQPRPREWRIVDPFVAWLLAAPASREPGTPEPDLTITPTA